MAAGREPQAVTSTSPPNALHFLLLMFSGWVSRQQQQVVDYPWRRTGYSDSNSAVEGSVSPTIREEASP